MQIVMIQDEIVSESALTRAQTDRGLFFGDGVYEVIRSYDGKIFALEEHLQRFARSMSEIGITGLSIDEIWRRVVRGYEESELADAKIYFHVTRGSGLRDHAGSNDMEPNFFMHITELTTDPATYEKGIRVSTYPDLRWKRCDIKSLNLLPNVMARRDADQKGCDEAILVNDEGFITEGAGSAFFCIFRNVLLTSPLSSNILPSITRSYVLRAAEKVQLPATETQIPAQEAREVHEAFIAVTTKGIVPVVEFDGVKIGTGQPGPWTNKLMDAFESFARGNE